MTAMRSIAALQRLTMQELRTGYAELFGETTAAKNPTWLLRHVAWRLQALAEGDLSERARQRAAELANDADLRTTVPRVKRCWWRRWTTTAGPGSWPSPSGPVASRRWLRR